MEKRIIEEQERLENKEQVTNDQKLIAKYRTRRQELLESNAKYVLTEDSEKDIDYIYACVPFFSSRAPTQTKSQGSAHEPTNR